MSTPEDWENHDKLLDCLGSRLANQRISLFLGAGASMGFGLPSWDSLLQEMYCEAGLAYPTGKLVTAAAEELLSKACGGDRVKLANNVRSALYRTIKATADDLENSRLLSAVGALVMSSVRGRVANVVTFNYDDILETYLRWRGLAVESIDRLPTWNSDVDLRVMHPHGLLPMELSIPVERGVVLTQLDYDKVVGDMRDLWRQKMIDIMRSTTCLFVGLSGADPNLTSMLRDVNENHTVTPHEPFWGVRLCAKGDSNVDTWKARGVFPMELDNHDAYSSTILEICRRAAIRRAARMQS